MKATLRLDSFAVWLRRQRDDVAVAKITARIDRVCLGNPGDVKPVGGGVSELRINYGPGYRIYYAERGNDRIILAGGTKKTQRADINEAKRLFEEWKRQK